MKRLVLSGLVVFIVAGFLCAQTRTTKRPVKPVVRATVTVKGDSNYSPPKIRRETDVGVWNFISVPEHRLKLELPSKQEELLDEVTQVEGGKVWEYSAATEFATYRLFIRDFPNLLTGKDLEDALIDRFEGIYLDRKVHILSRRTLAYGEAPGLEVMLEEKDMIQKARFYILNKKLFALYVTVEPKKNWRTQEKWADRFLGSFAVEFSSRGDS